MEKRQPWTPSPGDRVRRKSAPENDLCRVLSVNRRERTMSLWVPSGVDGDGDVVFETKMFSWNDVELVHSYR